MANNIAEMKIAYEGLTFDDVLLILAESCRNRFLSTLGPSTTRGSI